MSGDNARFLVVSGSIASQLKDLGSQVLHHSCHVDGCARAHPLGIVTFPGEFMQFKVRHFASGYLRSLWILPTGNCSPALLERDLALPLDFPPLPRPDISAIDLKRSEKVPSFTRVGLVYSEAIQAAQKELFGAGVLRHSLGALRHGMLCQLSRQ